MAEHYRREGNGESLVRALLTRALVYEEDHEPAKAIVVVIEALEHMCWYSPLRLSAYNILVDNLVGAGSSGWRDTSSSGRGGLTGGRAG